MNGRAAFRLGQGIGGLIAIAIVIFVAAWGDFLRLTADVDNAGAVVWLYDQDAAPGQRLEGRVWADGNNVVRAVDVGRIVPGLDPLEGGYKMIGWTVFDGEHADNTLDFTFDVPADAKPGDTLDLDIDPHTVPDDSASLHAQVRVYSRGMSVLRRIGKGGLAIACLAAVAGLMFALKRLAIRRARDPSGLWLVPVVAAGVFTFVPLTEQATRLHGWWFVGIVLATWAFGVFALAERFHRRIGLSTFTATPVLIETGPDGGYRGAEVTTPIRPVKDLETAWSAAGLVARRAGRDLILTRPRGLFAVVPVPASESFGAEPLVFRASDPELAKAIVAAAGTVLGELRVHEDVAL